MSLQDSPQTVSAERVSGGVFITFSDGEQGMYSHQALYAVLPAAKTLLAEILAGEQDPPLE